MLRSVDKVHHVSGWLLYHPTGIDPGCLLLSSHVKLCSFVMYASLAKLPSISKIVFLRNSYPHTLASRQETPNTLKLYGSLSHKLEYFPILWRETMHQERLRQMGGSNRTSKGVIPLTCERQEPESSEVVA